MSAKAIAKCFWHREVQEELLEHGLQEEWVFSSLKTTPTSGNYDDAMEFFDRKRSNEIYEHNCSDHCKGKGELTNLTNIIAHFRSRILSVS